MRISSSIVPDLVHDHDPQVGYDLIVTLKGYIKALPNTSSDRTDGAYSAHCLYPTTHMDTIITHYP